MKTKRNRLPAIEYLHQCFDYNEETGALTWRRRPFEHPFESERTWEIWNARYAGKSAGWPIKSGHMGVTLDGTKYRVHRIIWKWMTGEDPPENIDHRDTDPASNCWENLRRATESENKCNRGAQRNNTSGFKGVSWNKRDGKWKAQIKLNGKVYNLGLYETPEAAHAAYCAEAPRLHGEFARSRTDIVRPPRV